MRTIAWCPCSCILPFSPQLRLEVQTATEHAFSIVVQQPNMLPRKLGLAIRGPSLWREHLVTEPRASNDEVWRLALRLRVEAPHARRTHANARKVRHCLFINMSAHSLSTVGKATAQTQF